MNKMIPITIIGTNNSGNNKMNPIIIRGRPMIMPIPVEEIIKPIKIARIPAILVNPLTMIP